MFRSLCNAVQPWYQKYEISTVKAEREHFTNLLENRILEFVDEELLPHFGPLVTFVKELERTDNIEQVDGGMCVWCGVAVQDDIDYLVVMVRR